MSRDQKKQDKVIPFPGLEGRLLAKGLDLLQQKNYTEAIRLLDQALELSPGNADVYIGLILANFESGRLERARQLAAAMLHEGIGDYFQVADLYIMILVQLNRYDDVAVTIEALLQEQEVPPDKFEHFTKMLHFSRRMAEAKEAGQEEEPDGEHEQQDPLDLLSIQDPNQQVMLAARLANENIRAYINEVKKLLESPEGHPFQKTLLMNILREQEYDREIIVEKLGRRLAVVPSRLPELHRMKGLEQTLKLLGDQVENENPVLYESIKSLLERSCFILYPFGLQPYNPQAWAAACHYVAGSYFGMEETAENTAGLYEADYSETQEAISFLRKLEEISYPNI